MHPDWLGENNKEGATTTSRSSRKVYSLLSDKEQKAVYDEQGTVDKDSDVFNQDGKLIVGYSLKIYL